MKKLLILSFMVLLVGCAVNVTNVLNYQELVNILENEEADSLKVQGGRKQIRVKYPQSEKVYELAPLSCLAK